MGMKYWRNGDNVGIITDDVGQRIVLYAGNNAIEINGKTGQIALSGEIHEMNSDGRVEDVLIKNNTGLKNFLFSSLLTPLPKATPRLPVAELEGMIGDIVKMFTLMV